MKWILIGRIIVSSDFRDKFQSWLDYSGLPTSHYSDFNNSQLSSSHSGAAWYRYEIFNIILQKLINSKNLPTKSSLPVYLLSGGKSNQPPPVGGPESSLLIEPGGVEEETTPALITLCWPRHGTKQTSSVLATPGQREEKIGNINFKAYLTQLYKLIKFSWKQTHCWIVLR